MTDQILLVLHQPTSSPGRIGQYLSRCGYTLDIRRPVLGDALPETMEEHAGAVIFGGPMSANDDQEFIRRETDWISVPLREGAPFLGVCLGAQMLVKHLGGQVKPHPEGYAEVGYYPLHPTKAGKALMEWPETVYQWHREGMTLPSGVELLAKGDLFENQAVRVGTSAFGIQFHAELTLAMLYRWTTRGAARMELPGAQARREHFEGRGLHDVHILRWLHDFLDLWLTCDSRCQSLPKAAARG